VNDCCGDDDLLAGPVAPLAARRLGVAGFAMLWRGEQPLVSELADAATVDAMVRAGRSDTDRNRDGRRADLPAVHLPAEGGIQR